VNNFSIPIMGVIILRRSSIHFLRVALLPVLFYLAGLIVSVWIS
jgi:hypothetical protein